MKHTVNSHTQASRVHTIVAAQEHGPHARESEKIWSHILSKLSGHSVSGKSAHGQWAQVLLVSYNRSEERMDGSPLVGVKQHWFVWKEWGLCIAISFLLSTGVTRITLKSLTLLPSQLYSHLLQSWISNTQYLVPISSFALCALHMNGCRDGLNFKWESFWHYQVEYKSIPYYAWVQH